MKISCGRPFYVKKDYFKSKNEKGAKQAVQLSYILIFIALKSRRDDSLNCRQ
jgi:hypothetical protein